VKGVSMHSSKGLEFPLAFIPRAGQMPSESLRALGPGHNLCCSRIEPSH
jgi:ATP-dependent exoDNAse (exonuclease V) beta subunit